MTTGKISGTNDHGVRLAARRMIRRGLFRQMVQMRRDVVTEWAMEPWPPRPQSIKVTTHYDLINAERRRGPEDRRVKGRRES